MSMLAEKKSRQKWCLNPNGNAWAKDENKFGQRMLMKMGWEPGTGLGARGQGMTNILKAKVKCDTKGLGNEHKDNADNWKKTLESYDTLLAQLSGTSNDNEDESIPIQSLEEKSKTSRTRVHYHKFTRGKDISKYSTKDLKCILPLDVKENKGEDDINRDNDMYSYFKNKHTNPYKIVKRNSTEMSTDDGSNNNVVCDSEEEIVVGKKKKKKKRNYSLEICDNNTSISKGKSKLYEEYFNGSVEECQQNNYNEENENFSEELISKKSKKSKNKKLSKTIS